MISKNNIEKLEKSYMDACHDEDFLNYVSSIDLSDDELMKYTSKLEECVIEAANCKKCPSKKECKNSVNGYCFKSFLENNILVLSFFFFFLFLQVCWTFFLFLITLFYYVTNIM